MPKKVLPGRKISTRSTISPSTDLPEPEYVDDEEMIPVSQQKWKIPKDPMEIKILKAARPFVKNPRYQDHHEKKAVQDIVRGSMSLKSGVVSSYPTEWVEHCIQWCMMLWKDHKPMPLQNLIKYINNKDKMSDWIARWQNENLKRE